MCIFRFNWKFICVPIRLTNLGSDLTLAYNKSRHFFSLSFGFFVYCFVFWLVLILFCLNLQYLSDVNVVDVLFSRLIFFVGSPLIYILKGVLFETITFYLYLFVKFNVRLPLHRPPTRDLDFNPESQTHSHTHTLSPAYAKQKTKTFSFDFAPAELIYFYERRFQPFFLYVRV